MKELTGVGVRRNSPKVRVERFRIRFVGFKGFHGCHGCDNREAAEGELLVGATEDGGWIEMVVMMSKSDKTRSGVVMVEGSSGGDGGASGWRGRKSVGIAVAA
jgi:hypothetical protein